MDTRQLKTFITLAKTLSYQKTSEQLTYAPSTLYSHIQSLENELQVPLFDKVGKRLFLTKEGERFLVYAKKLLADYEEAMDAVSREAVPEGSVGLGGCEVNTAYNVVNAISAFAVRNPAVRLNMASASNSSIPGMVREGEIDLGFYFTLKEEELPGLQALYLYQEPVCLLAAEDHPLAKKEQVHYADLEGVDFAFPHDDCLFVVEMLRRFAQNQVHIGRASYLGGVQLVLESLFRTKALAIMPLSAVRKLQERMRIVPLDFAEPRLWVWEVVLYKDFSALSPAGKTFYRHCQAYARERLSGAMPEELRAPGHMG